MKSEELVMYIIPFIWEKFKKYLNDPNYYVRSNDILQDKFGKGKKDVKSLCKDINKRFPKIKLEDLDYGNLTYQELLNKIFI
jgi:hypothetical protein